MLRITNQKTIEEIYSVRAIACLCVVFLHSVKINYNFTMDSGDIFNLVINYIAGFLAFGTAAFVFISELLLSHAYPHGLREGFWKKRFYFILTPFVIMGGFYAVLSLYMDGGGIYDLGKQFILNVFAGGFHGWFVLVIFQFYLLHILYTKYLKNKKPKAILIGTFVINISYLVYFNYSVPFSNYFLASYIWDRGYWILPFGWIFYFSLAYYAGRNYMGFIDGLKKYKIWVVIGTFISLCLVIFNNINFDLSLGSKRWDMIFFTTFAVLLLFLVTSNIKKVPKALKVVSDCSFGIYLIHYFLIMAFKKMFDILNVNNDLISIVLLFILAVTSSVAIVYALNYFKLGKYIIGKVKIPRRYTSLKKSILNWWG